MVIMKNLIYIILSFILISCGNSTDSGSNDNAAEEFNKEHTAMKEIQQEYITLSDEIKVQHEEWANNHRQKVADDDVRYIEMEKLHQEVLKSIEKKLSENAQVMTSNEEALLKYQNGEISGEELNNMLTNIKTKHDQIKADIEQIAKDKERLTTEHMQALGELEDDGFEDDI